jgi:hypothetical protein
MLLEPTRLGVTLELERLPVPDGVALAEWLGCFPCYAFLLCCPSDRADVCTRAFRDRGLTAEALGVLDDSGRVRLAAAGETATAFDLRAQEVTHLRR